jgi:hypothetical protein
VQKDRNDIQVSDWFALRPSVVTRSALMPFLNEATGDRSYRCAHGASGQVVAVLPNVSQPSMAQANEGVETRDGNGSERNRSRAIEA